MRVRLDNLGLQHSSADVGPPEEREGVHHLRSDVKADYWPNAETFGSVNAMIPRGGCTMSADFNVDERSETGRMILCLLGIIKDEAGILLPDTWTTREGKTVKIKEMETAHLQNAVAMLERTNPPGKPGGKSRGPAWTAMKKELAARVAAEQKAKEEAMDVNTLKNRDLSAVSQADDLIVLSLELKNLEAHYEELGLDVPEWLPERQREVHKEIKDRTRQLKLKRRKEILSELERSKSAEQKRRDLSGELKKLNADLGDEEEE